LKRRKHPCILGCTCFFLWLNLIIRHIVKCVATSFLAGMARVNNRRVVCSQQTLFFFIFSLSPMKKLLIGLFCFLLYLWFGHFFYFFFNKIFVSLQFNISISICNKLYLLIWSLFFWFLIFFTLPFYIIFF
jgi:hypothetical protein